MKRFAWTYVTSLLVCASAAYAQEIPAEYQQVLTALGKQGDYKARVSKQERFTRSRSAATT